MVDIGVRCIYGKVPLTPAVRDLVPFLRGFNFLSDDACRGIAFAPVLLRTPPEEYGDSLMTGTNDVLGCADDELSR